MLGMMRYDVVKMFEEIQSGKRPNFGNESRGHRRLLSVWNMIFWFFIALLQSIERYSNISFIASVINLIIDSLPTDDVDTILIEKWWWKALLHVNYSNIDGILLAINISPILRYICNFNPRIPFSRPRESSTSEGSVCNGFIHKRGEENISYTFRASWAGLSLSTFLYLAVMSKIRKQLRSLYTGRSVPTIFEWGFLYKSSISLLQSLPNLTFWIVGLQCLL